MKRFIWSMVIALLSFSALAQSNEGVNGSGPKLVFDKSVIGDKGNVVHDYGTIVEGGDGDCVFKFSNEGSEPLVLSKVRSSCGCTVPTWPRQPIMPGESSEIQVKYDTKKIGNIYKSIYIYSNASDTPVVAQIKGNVVTKESMLMQKDDSEGAPVNP